MIITDKFVYVHQPKTGGTFVAAALRCLYDVEGLGIGDFQTRFGRFISRKKHARRKWIPEEHRSKTVLGTVRNPYDWYVSQYVYGWWKKPRWFKDYLTDPDFNARFPTFPKVSFSDYVHWANGVWGAHENADGHALGALTTKFIQFYFRDPDDVLATPDDKYFTTGRYRQSMADVHFIHTCRLNAELQDFLLNCGYPSRDVAFVLELDRVIPAPPPQGRMRSASDNWRSFYTAELKAFVRQRERHFFAIFPEFDC